MKEFDLNIGKVLENWSIAHAIREIIANALDEQVITRTKEISIYKENGRWHIRDFGRGLKYSHLTQNENEEKMSHPGLIGKFGVGLKDALATFDRHNIGVQIDSRYGHYTIGKSKKYGFSDIVTLHAYIDEPVSKELIGTDFTLEGCTDKDMENAKSFFLIFNKLTLFESTPYGEIYTKKNEKSEIYINGIKIAEEENFLFSYNITAINSALRKALNRERTNVGRSAYSERIRNILLSVKSVTVIDQLTENLSAMSSGKQCDEMKWLDVQTYAIKLLNSRGKTVFITPEEMRQSSGRVLEIIQNSGKKPVFIPDTVKRRIICTKDINGNRISTVSTVIKEYNDSFEYEFISYDNMTDDEKSNYDLIPYIINLLGSNFPLNRIFISEILKNDSNEKTLGIYEKSENRIVILRSQLKSRKDFLGTLIHELTHADSGFSDVSRDFEKALTNITGDFANKILKLENDIEDYKNNSNPNVEKLKPLKSLQSEELEKILADIDAKETVNEEDNNLAIKICNILICRHPSDDAYYHDSASFYLIANNYQKAIEMINIAIDIAPQKGSYHRDKGIILFSKGEYKAALDEFNAALELCYEDEDIYLYSAKCYIEQGDYSKMMKCYENGFKNYPDNLGISLNYLRALIGNDHDFEKANKIADISIERYPEEGDFYYLKSVALVHLMRIEEAYKAVDNAIRLKPDDVNSYKLLGYLDGSIKKNTNLSI